jgi:hypothetical protein
LGPILIELVDQCKIGSYRIEDVTEEDLVPLDVFPEELVAVDDEIHFFLDVLEDALAVEGLLHAEIVEVELLTEFVALFLDQFF